MVFHPFPRREPPTSRSRRACLEGRDIRWWWWWWCAHEHLHHPFSSKNRRRPIRHGGQLQHASVAEYPASVVARVPHEAHFISGNTLNPIVLGQAFVDERVVGIQEFEDA